MISKLLNFINKFYFPLYIYILIPIVLCLVLTDFMETYTLIDSALLRSITEKCLSAINEGKDYSVSGEISLKKQLPNLFSLKLLNIDSQTGKFKFTFSSGRNPELKEKYSVLYTLIDFRFLLVIVFLWLFPVYRYNFSKKYSNIEKIEKRIINLPLFLFILTWLIAVSMCMIKLYLYKDIFKSLNYKVILLYSVTSVIFGCFVSFFSIGITLRYINRSMALPFFKDNSPYTLKKGIPITLSGRITLMIISLGIVPTLLSILVLLSFNEGLFKSQYDRIYILQHIDILLPLFMMIIIGVYFFTAQIIAIFSFRASIQRPINGLIERMGLVSKGELDCKSPVLYTDEIGQLNGHFNSMLDSLQKQHSLKSKFGKFVSEEIAQQIINSDKVKLTGEEIYASVLFSDIRNFTPFSEKLSPTELVEFLNLYFSYMVKPIHQNLGLVNKFIGDAVMVIFSKNFGAEDHATSAVKAAIGMSEALKEFNALNRYPKISHGIGIHTGILVAGNIGTASRMEFTVIGDNVNIASRIESMTKELNTNILISKSVREYILASSFPDHKFVICDPVMMKGKSEPFLLYKLVEAS